MQQQQSPQHHQRRQLNPFRSTIKSRESIPQQQQQQQQQHDVGRHSDHQSAAASTTTQECGAVARSSIKRLKLDIRIQIVSDLHLEFYEIFDRIPNDIISRRAPVLALLGDIGLAYTDLLRSFLHQQADCFEHVLFVAGNHEYYNHKTSHTVQEQMSWMRWVCNERENLHFLEMDAVEIEGVLILGTTLWSHIPSNMTGKAESCMNDYNLCFVANQQRGRARCPTPMKAAFTNQWHAESVRWLEEQIDKARSKPVIVLTHHTPLLQGTSHPKYDGSDLNCCFSTDLKHLLQHPSVKVWACGHTHYNFDRNETGTRLVSNQCGYPGQENMDYDNTGVVIRVSPLP